MAGFSRGCCIIGMVPCVDVQCVPFNLFYLCLSSSGIHFLCFSFLSKKKIFYCLTLTFISVLCFSASDFYFVFLELVSGICKYALACMSFFFYYRVTDEALLVETT